MSNLDVWISGNWIVLGFKLIVVLNHDLPGNRNPHCWGIGHCWHCSYILKARVLEVQTPQTICNFPQIFWAHENYQSQYLKANNSVLGFRSFDILLSNCAFLDFLLIYHLHTFPQIFCDWKADSANFIVFRMYDNAVFFLLRKKAVALGSAQLLHPWANA